jgi:flagellar basal body-associated protein FliL
MVVAGKQRRSRKFWIGLVLMVLLAVMICVGCGGVASSGAKAATTATGTAAATGVAPGTYPITIQATAGSTQQATTATLVVN